MLQYSLGSVLGPARRFFTGNLFTPLLRDELSTRAVKLNRRALRFGEVGPGGEEPVRSTKTSLSVEREPEKLYMFASELGVANNVSSVARADSSVFRRLLPGDCTRSIEERFCSDD